jgi:hypothetical protein
LTISSCNLVIRIVCTRLYKTYQLRTTHSQGDAAEFLENIADTTTLGGQAIVGVMREGRNNARLSTAGLYNTNQIPSDAEIAPIPVIDPSYLIKSAILRLILC